MEGSLSSRKWASMNGVVNDSLLRGVDSMGYEYV